MTTDKKAPNRNGVGKTPPHSPEAEQAILGCLLEAPESMKECTGLKSEMFWDVRNQEIFMLLREMHRKGKVVDVSMFYQFAKDQKAVKLCGGFEYVSTLPNAFTSQANLPYWLTILREKYALRTMQQVCRSVDGRIADYEGNVSELMTIVQAELDIASRLGLPKKDRPRLRIWRASELAAYQRPTHLDLVGDNEIFMGYEGVVVFAGPGSSGKSLCTAALALAGARGSGTWMGRRVHRQFRSLVLQAENGKGRLKRMVDTMAALHPDIDIENNIFFSEPPEGGLPFESNEFRSAVREEVDRIKPDLVILDPWSHVGCEDSADAIKSKLTEIRSCFPAGDACPCLLIVAHTKKPRSEDVRKGRGLMYMVSGSINLVNTSRCTYIMLPWSDDLEDKRVYFATPKLNDGENYAATVWFRMMGTDFQHDEKTNAKDFGKVAEEEDGRAIKEEDLRAVFEKKPEMKAAEIVNELVKLCGCGSSTAWRATNEDGYLRPLMKRTAHGKWSLRMNDEVAK